ncbi:putative ribonuclease H-like domain-containing protein [Tanacetum coccineum]
MAFVSTPGSTNEVNTATVQVSTANSPVSTAGTPDSIANLSDATIYAFMANQPNGSQLVHEDLEQIHEDDLEEMDLKWQLALLSMRARRYFQMTGNVEESRPRNQDNRNRNQDSSRRIVNVEDTSSKAMVAIDGAGFDWSFMADEEVPTNMALMAFSDSKVYNHKTCSDTCLKSFETLKTQYDNLRIEFNQSEFNLATYKRGLASVKEQLVFYKKNEVMFCDQINVLKRDASFKDSEINALKSEIEKLKNGKECNQIKINKFENASKSLDKLIGSQISDNSRKGVGFVSYNVVPPPPIGLFAPPTIDLSNSGLKEFQMPKFEGYGPKSSKSFCVDTSNEVKKTPDATLVKELVSEKEKQIVFSTKIEFVKQQEKPDRKPVKYAEMYRSQKPRGNQRNWNNQKSQQLGNNFVMYNKACFVCGSFDHVQANCKYHQKERVVSGNNYTRVIYNYNAKKAHPGAYRIMTPRAVLMKTGLKPLNTARLVKTAHPKTIVHSARPLLHFYNTAQSTIKRPYQTKTTLTNNYLNQKVNTAKGEVYTAMPKAVKTVRPNSAVVNASTKEDQGITAVDSGCSRHMTGNMFCLSDFKEFDGGYVTFGGGSRGGKITGKGTLKTGKLDFEDVYFVKELQFNIFSVLQMCDKKNSILFNDTGCFILYPDFKLADESQILLKVPRKNNMYSVDMKNIIPIESLTCLVAKAALDESMLWHRRLGHVNFKTINKLVKENLVRGLPAKHFKNDQSCVACLKGKQHKASCIKREYSIARTPQQNGVAEKRNMTLIKAARTILAYSKLPTTFWAEAVNTACYVQNKFRGFANNAGKKTTKEPANEGERNGQEKEGGASNKEHDQHVKDLRAELDKLLIQEKEGYANSTNRDNTVSPSVSTVGASIDTASANINIGSVNINTAPNDSSMQSLEATGIFDGTCDDEDVGAEVDLNNLETIMNVSHIPTTRIHKDHPKDQIIGDINSATQTRRMTKTYEEHALKVWTLLDLPNGKRAIGTKTWYRNKKDERGIVVRNNGTRWCTSYDAQKIPDELYGGAYILLRTAGTTEEGYNFHQSRQVKPKLGPLARSPRDSPFDLEAFFDSDYARASIDRKSTIRGVDEGSGQPTDPQHTSTSAQLYIEEPIPVLFFHQPKKTQKPRTTKRPLRYLSLSGPTHLVADETVYKDWEDGMEKAVTTASSLKQSMTMVTSIGPNPWQHLMSQVLRKLVQVVVPSAKLPYWGCRSSN